jgi:molybdopterin-guanine dinucleotide biosynthesis protein B
MNALAIDNSVMIKDYELPKDVDILNLNDPDEVILWILKNAKEV